MQRSEIGVHGKLPAHGDFLTQGLPGSFVDPWDHWLQRSLLASQEAAGGSWLDLFLVSPVWQFALSPNVVDEHAWAGILFPSVDSVGRYFPLTIAARLPAQIGVFEFMSSAENWFEQLENVGMNALHDALTIETLLGQLANLGFAMDGEGRVTALSPQNKAQYRVMLDGPVNTVTPLLCDALLKPSAAPISIWSTKGAQNVDSALLIAEKLPRPMSYMAMLNGQWDQWHWPNLVQ